MLVRWRRQAKASRPRDPAVQPAKEATATDPKCCLLNETLDLQDFDSYHKHVAVTQEQLAPRKQREVLSY
jgi:hypothetical protein